MADKCGETQAVARTLMRGYDMAQDVAAALSGNVSGRVTMETMTGHAFTLTYDGREYVVLVTPESASPLMQAEFGELGQ